MYHRDNFILKNSFELFHILCEGKSYALGCLMEVYDWIISGIVSVLNIYNLYRFEDVSVSMRISNILKHLW